MHLLLPFTKAKSNFFLKKQVLFLIPKLVGFWFRVLGSKFKCYNTLISVSLYAIVWIGRFTRLGETLNSTYKGETKSIDIESFLTISLAELSECAESCFLN
jgi:hypothetical protein